MKPPRNTDNAEYRRRKIKLGKSCRDLLAAYQAAAAEDQSNWSEPERKLAAGLGPRDMETLWRLAQWANLDPDEPETEVARSEGK